MIKSSPISDTLPLNTASANPHEDYLWFLVAGGVTAVVLAAGLFVFASNLDAREMYHGWYVLGFFILTIGFSAALAAKKFGTSAFLLLLVIADLGISWAKFDWHRGLLADINAPGQVSVLGDYVRTLPTLEEHWMASYTNSGGPDWVRFDKECYKPALTGGAFSPNCKTKDLVTTTYRLPIMQFIDQRFQLMKTTAKRVNDKGLTTKVMYDTCVSDGSCAQIPLLPAAVVDPTLITPVSEEYKDIRNAFWLLVDKDKLTIGACEAIPLCKAMTITGAVVRTDFQDADTNAVVAPAS